MWMKPRISKTPPRYIVKGASYDNNLLYIAEKEVFAVESVFDELLNAMQRNGGYRLNAREIDQLSAAFKKANDGHWVLNRDLVGLDATKLAELIGVRALPGRSCCTAKPMSAIRMSAKSR
ncbi:MAG: hypothetical protein U0903_15280 [Planctomycetales bacterium]